METTATAITSTLPVVASTNPLVNFASVVIIVVIVSILKYFAGNYLSERTKDVVFPILSAVFSALGMFLGFIDVSNISDVVSYLVAPSGLFITLKKIAGK